MTNLLKAIAVTLFLVSVVGMALAQRDKLKITSRDEKRDFVVTITLRDLTPEYRWLSVYVCTAELGEDHPQPFCNYFWERESGQEVRQDQVQYPFLFRNAPRGTMWVFAMAFDANKEPLARGQATVLRGR